MKTLEYDQRQSPHHESRRDPAPAKPRPNPSGDAPLSPVQSDAQILDVHKELKIADAHASTFTTTYVKRILTYAGKIRESEIKIPYNPATQTARLLRGAVISKTGQTNEVSTGEINIMDAGWNASAKRYTGEKILVANLPGVEIGSTIEVSYEITNTNQPYISGYEYFQMPEALEHKTVTVTGPAGIEIHERVSGAETASAKPLQQEHSTEGGSQTFRWEASHVPALPAEGSLPPAWSFNSGVTYFVGDMASYFQTLNDTMLNRSPRKRPKPRRRPCTLASPEPARQAGKR